ncbi:MAG: C25 family cysteine peptidase [candidate division WOR-3 bacterium]|nr:C25 family cysteine peptidase [candidate division WOR-3 bacterium]
MYTIKILIFFGLLVPLTLPSSVVAAEEIPLCSQEGTLIFNLEMPSFEFVTLENGETRIIMEGASYRQVPGYPRLPKLTYTFALPPAGEAVEVEVRGARFPLEGTYLIEASPPQLPRSASVDVTEKLYSLYEENRARVYSGAEKLSDELGKINAKGERREYSLVNVALYPFYYDPLSGRLSVASDVTLRIHYAPASEEHAEFVKAFMEKGTLYEDVPECIYNKGQAREWYRPQERLLANPGMIILTTEALKPYVNRYVYWRESTGFQVTVVTLEEILSSSVEGVDTRQKIRNWLRENVADFNYLFIIGHHFSLPMRTLTLFNDNTPPSWMDDPAYYPHPSDIYYGDLSKPDSSSWDLDGDGYYGEVLTTSGSSLYPQDSPDLEMELKVGRLNCLSTKEIPETLERTWLFEASKDLTYKKSSVLVGGILGYYSADDKWDDSYYMEQLMDRGVVERSSAVTLYEKEGDNPSGYDCDLPFTQSNLVSTLSGNNAGVFMESNHGEWDRFFRCVWYDYNEDDDPEYSELEWPDGLTRDDATNLNSSHPNVAFLMSCLCGKPEASTCLAQALLNHGSVGVVANVRVAWGADWVAPGDGGDYDLFYYTLHAYLKKETLHDYVIGDAFCSARSAYWSEADGIGDFCNAYGYRLYGDPALRHMGREGAIPPAVAESPPASRPTTLSVDAGYRVSFSLPRASEVQIDIWDVAGRKVETLFNGHADAGTQTIVWDTQDLPAGAYFITLKAQDGTYTTKAVVIH